MIFLDGSFSNAEKVEGSSSFPSSSSSLKCSTPSPKASVPRPPPASSNSPTPPSGVGSRAGQHSQRPHDRLLRALTLTHVQLDELRLKLHGTAEAAWLWIACDAHTKLIPAFRLGPRTQTLAHQLVHELAQRLAPSCLPIFSSDGLALYFYALTAHFGQWVREIDHHRHRWVVEARLLYAQVLKRYRRRRLAEVRQHMCLGSADEYRQALRAKGLSGRIQTAFVERLRLRHHHPPFHRRTGAPFAERSAFTQ